MNHITATAMALLCIAGQTTLFNKESTCLQLNKLLPDHIVVLPQGPLSVVINEMMVDPSPPLGQPNAEYVELLNPTEESIQLADFSFSVGSQTVLIPQYLLPAGEFVVIADEDDIDSFAHLQNIIGLNLPALTNSGNRVELSDAFGNPLHTLYYDLSSYQDASRDNGGWSLELINPLTPCIQSGNLKACQDLTGGTPGRVNSVAEPSEDIAGPNLIRITPESDSVVQLTFDEMLMGSPAILSFTPVLFIASQEVVEQTLIVKLESRIEKSVLYTISIENISDCIGNNAGKLSGEFGLPEPPAENDILINEILFDPATGGSRFIELINISDKFIDMSQLVIGDIRGDTIDANPISIRALLLPREIIAITPDISDITSHYPSHNSSQLLTSDLPAFDRTAGNATVYSRDGVVLDVLNYNSAFHNPLLDDTRGVSLERISTSLSTGSPDTWQSAAASIGFGTPGLPNSQQLHEVPGDDLVQIQPETFSPDGDGYNDFLTILFEDPSPGSVANILVFDPSGREIARPANNLSVGTGSVVIWEGINLNGQRARIGPHVILVEVHDPDGHIIRIRKGCVLAGRL